MAKFTVFVSFLTIIAISVIQESSSSRFEYQWRRESQKRDTEHHNGLTEKGLKQEFEEAFRTLVEVEKEQGRSLTLEELEELENKLEKHPKYYKFAKFIASQYNSLKDPVKNSLSKRQSGTNLKTAKDVYPDLYE